MKTYETKVTFSRQIRVKAKNAEEANRKLESRIEQSEFGGDVECEDWFEFEDEPIACPDCDGDCLPCLRCDGEGEIYPDEYFDDE